jgi:hypothetical protein
MIKKFSAVALATMLALPSLAAAGGGASVADLEKKMEEMTKAFNAQIQTLQQEVSNLKSADKDLMATDDKLSSSIASAGSTVAPAPTGKKITLGGQIRMRGYNLQNVWDFQDDGNINLPKASAASIAAGGDPVNLDGDRDNWGVFRHKTTIWAKIDATEKVSGFVALSNQNWGEGVSATDAGMWEIDNMSNKVFVDNAYIDIKAPINFRIGRQNVMYGSGFVLFDGNSQFGSTSIFLDGIKASFKLNDNVTLDGLYFKDWEGSRDNESQGDDDITVGGFYLTNKVCPLTGAKQELYALNRTDQGLHKDIWMYGLRMSDKMDCGFDYSLEGAIQTGDAGETALGKTIDQDAYGLKLGGGYTFKDVSMTPRIYLGYAFLSGDDDSTDDDSDRWDVFYGGHAPQFGDIIAFKYLNVGEYNVIARTYDLGYNELSSTGGEAVYSNLENITIGASANLLKNLSAKVSWSMLEADETHTTLAGYSFDDDIGDVYQLTLKYKYTDKLAFTLYGAMFDPGDAFDDNDPLTDYEDSASELFLEADYRF